MCGEERRGSYDATVQFRHRLAELKHDGCNILLVGTDALDAVCERLLGESGAGPRYRLFVTTDAGPEDARARLESVRAGPDGDEAAVVNWQADVRGGTATGSSSRGPTRVSDGPAVRREGGPVTGSGGDSREPPFRRVTVEGDELRDLGRTVEETVDAFGDGTGELSPSELRLCFDSLVPLVADHEPRDVRRFLVGLTETVERHDGMAHYHLPAEYGSETVAAVEKLFDAVVEVRYGADGVEQRWHLAEPDLSTDWLPL